jgi:hypothetical protein
MTIVFDNLGFGQPVHEYTTTTCGPNKRLAYEGCNPLLRDSMRNDILLLNRPHVGGIVSMDYNSTSIGGVYKNHLDIKGGHIQYYIPEESPIQPPIFSTNQYFHPSVRHDPMNVPYFQYDKREITRWVPGETLSHISDNVEFRDDLTNLQMRRYDKNNYTYAWNTLNR